MTQAANPARVRGRRPVDGERGRELRTIAAYLQCNADTPADVPDTTKPKLKLLKLHRDGQFCGAVLPAELDKNGAELSFFIDESSAPHVTRDSGGSTIGTSPKHCRGGTRLRADRVSEHLTRAQVDNLIAATRHAITLGLEFTRMITIHWERAGVSLEDIAKATGRYLDLLRKTLTRHGAGHAAIWVQEGGDGKGGHCHILAHVPARVVDHVTRLQRGWIKSITGRPYRGKSVRTRPVGGRLGLEVSNPALYGVNLAKSLAYLIKGANRDAAQHFNLTRLAPSGLCIGKRCGTSQNIGPKARLQTRRETKKRTPARRPKF